MSARHWSADADAIHRIAAWLIEGGLAEIEIGDADGTRLRIVAEAGGELLDPRPATPAASTDTLPVTVTVTAPAFGHLRLATASDGTPRPAAGAVVRRGETIAVLEVGTVAIPVVSPCDGTVAQWLVAPDALVGYAAALARLDPASGSQA